MAIRTFTKPSSLAQKLNSSVHSMVQSDEKSQKNGNRERTSPRRNGPKRDGTFAFQEQLPQLPIPDLESTCEKYLDALRPLQSEKEQHESKIAVRDFLRYQGPELQEKLKKYAAGKSNYIEQFCKTLFSPRS